MDNFGERVRFDLREWEFVGGWDTWVWVRHKPCNAPATYIVTGDDFLRAVMEHQCETEGRHGDLDEKEVLDPQTDGTIPLRPFRQREG